MSMHRIIAYEFIEQEKEHPALPLCDHLRKAFILSQIVQQLLVFHYYPSK